MMSDPVTPTPVVPTQSQFPWKTVARTIFQTILTLAIVLPVVITNSGISTTIPVVAGALVFCAALTRIMAMPEVEWFLQKFTPWLAASAKR
jgi:hypothetical protein